MMVLPVQQTDEDVDGGDVCDCGSNVATIGVVVTLIIDPTRSGVAELLQLMLLLMLLLLLLLLSGSACLDHVVSHVALHVQSVVGITGA